MAPTKPDKDAIENGVSLMLQYNSQGLIPVFVTAAESGTVLMQAWMNEEAVRKTLATGEAHYWSRSRQELWHKGATSGEYQIVKDFRVDCDQDSVWLVVDQLGGKCCHVGYESCFYRSVPLGAPAENNDMTITSQKPKGS